MNIWLKELSIDDGKEFFDLLMNLTNDNSIYNRLIPDDFSIEEYESFKRTRLKLKNDSDLPEFITPASTYWIMNDNIPIGYGIIRHRLSFNQKGGHLGICLKKEYQTNEIRIIVSNLMSDIAYNDLDINEIVYVVNEDNEKNKQIVHEIGGVLIYKKDNNCFYKVDLEEKFRKERRIKL